LDDEDDNENVLPFEQIHKIVLEQMQRVSTTEMQDDNIMNDKSIKEFPDFLNDPISLEPISNPVWTK